MRYFKRADANTKEIADALRKAGATVYHLGNVGKGVPDLMVGVNAQTFLIEVKNRKTHARKVKGDGDGLHTPDQEKFIREWRGGPVFTIYSIDEALKVTGL
jgi:Holliday junction resolvase